MDRAVRGVLSLVVCLACFVLFLTPARGQQFSFEVKPKSTVCGGTVFGPAGQTVRVPMVASIQADVDGVAGWAMSIGTDDNGLVFGQDPQCLAPCASKLIFGPSAAGNEVQFNAPFPVDPTKEPVSGPLAGLGPQGPGIVDGVVLTINPLGAITLEAGTSTVIEFFVETTVPQNELGKEVTVFFKNGLQGPGAPTVNTVTVENLSIDPTLGSCTFRVRPQAAVVELKVAAANGTSPTSGISGVDIPGPVGARGAGTAYVMLNTSIDDSVGVAGWQLSVSHSESIDVVSAHIASELYARVPDLDGSVGFNFTEFFPDVDPNRIFFPQEPPNPDCELTPGQAQGFGLVSGVIFDTQPSPGKASYLPGNTGGFIRLLEIDYEQSSPFVTEDDPPQTGGFQWLNCLEGSGIQVRTSLTVRGRSVVPTAREGLNVTFRPARQSLFIRGDANDDSLAGDLSDALYSIDYLFGIGGGRTPGCLDALDANDDNKRNLADPIWIINALFRGGPQIPGGGTCITDPDSTPTSCPPGSVTHCQ